MIITDADRPLMEVTTSRSRRIRNHLATIWMYGSLIVAVIPLGFVLFTLIQKGAGQLSVSWFTDDLPAITRKAGGGMGPAIAGTLLITFGATLLAVPLGILGAIYIHEYGAQSRLATLVRFMAEVMTGVPSIVMGLFVYTIFTLNTEEFSGLGGSLALACLMLPIVIRSTEEMLRLVPDDLRNASYALGNRKWRTILTVVLPAALGGIVSGVMLAVARAAGETAPLLFTIGAARKFNPNLFSGATTALSAQIWSNAQTPFRAAQDRAWGAALTLVGIVFIFTLIARAVSSRFALKAA